MSDEGTNTSLENTTIRVQVPVKLTFLRCLLFYLKVNNRYFGPFVYCIFLQRNIFYPWSQRF